MFCFPWGGGGGGQRKGGKGGSKLNPECSRRRGGGGARRVIGALTNLEYSVVSVRGRAEMHRGVLTNQEYFP